jgi:hypothetical protein
MSCSGSGSKVGKFVAGDANVGFDFVNFGTKS